MAKVAPQSYKLPGKKPLRDGFPNGVFKEVKEATDLRTRTAIIAHGSTACLDAGEDIHGNSQCAFAFVTTEGEAAEKLVDCTVCDSKDTGWYAKQAIKFIN